MSIDYLIVNLFKSNAMVEKF